MRKLFRRLWYRLNRERLERELEGEMEAHREMMAPDCRSQFGSTARLAEDSREVWTWAWFEQALQDVSYGIRVLCQSPGFTLGAVAVLALGVGINVAEFQKRR